MQYLIQCIKLRELGVLSQKYQQSRHRLKSKEKISDGALSLEGDYSKVGKGATSMSTAPMSTGIAGHRRLLNENEGYQKVVLRFEL